jgi:ketosteroid isomerase-like protein
MCRFLLGILLAGSLQGCGQRPAPDAEAVRKIIDGHNVSLERWYASGEIDSVAARFAQDVWQFPPNNQPLVGRDSLRSFWRAAVKWGRWEFDFAAQDVVARESVAIERGRYALKFTAATSGPMPSFADQGNYVVFWRQILMANGVLSGTHRSAPCLGGSTQALAASSLTSACS